MSILATSSSRQIHDTEPRWFAVHTRSKCEKMVASLLLRKQIHAYLPLVRTLRRYTRKVKKVEKPLIGCYVFVRITKTEYLTVLETEHVAGFVRFSKELIAIPDEEINLIRRLVLEEDIELEAVPGVLSPGDPVMITAGPLMGLKGAVVEQAGKRKFKVALENLGYSLLMTIDAHFIQKTGIV